MTTDIIHKGLSNIDDYYLYKEKLELLTDLKNTLYEKVKQRADIRSRYYKYLEDNPYRRPFLDILKEIEDIRDKIISEIPEK